MKDELTRRNFVVGAGAFGVMAGLGLAGCSAEETAPAESSSGGNDDSTEAVQKESKEKEAVTTEQDAEQWDLEAEVVVAGFGAAGAAAAYEAALGGADVLLLEKAELPGGSIARCGGAMAGGGTKVQEELGIGDSAEEYYQWVMTSTAGLADEEIVRVYCDNAGKNIDWYNDLAIEIIGEPVFQAKEAAGMKNGVNAIGVTYDAFDYPEEKRFARSHWATCYDDLASASGPELFDPIFGAVEGQDNIKVEYKTALKKLVQNKDGVVVGVIADQDGQEIKIRAKKGVMLGTGGFPNSPEMKAKFCVDAKEAQTYMSDMCVGDGIKAAMDIGADLNNMMNWYPTPKQTYKYNPDYEGVYHMWLENPDNPNWMEVPADSMAETHGGVVINPEAQVLDVWGEVIPHLYAAGCDSGSNVFGKPGNYPGCGCYVAYAICFGRIAGQNLAKETEV